MNKLDSAFDIDPLFHKMSKNFDEGGAKGLLLVNLGLGPQCNIVFDSSGDEVAGEDPETSRNDDGDIEVVAMEHLTSKMLDPDEELMELPLVPQLANLRAQLEDLAFEGFLDDGALVDSSSSSKARRASASTGRRYAAKDEEEDEADVTIHQEVAERSLRLSTGYPGGYQGRYSSNEGEFDESLSQPVASTMKMPPGDDDQYAPDDFGGGDDDYDDYGGTELVFDEVEVSNVAPSISSPPVLDHRDKSSAELRLLASSSQATSNLLDTISSSSHVHGTSDYEFLSARMMKDNAWAGATFWKRKEKRKVKAAEVDKSAPKKKPSRKKKQTKGFVFDAVPDLSDILVKPKKQLLQWSRAVINKHSKEDNLLPLDAGFGVEQLSQLFLRPDMTMLTVSSIDPDPRHSNKAVDFDPAVETWAPPNDDSFGGGDDDGPGYDFGDDFGDGDRFEEGDAGFTVPELKGVRKVEKVHVGYATVAKKVDVKRLKKDLWDEVESHFLSSSDSAGGNEDQPASDSVQRASFQTIVQDMESSKSQPDASLPFYFICMLHLANEKGLRLESQGLGDFDIYPDSMATGPSF